MRGAEMRCNGTRRAACCLLALALAACAAFSCAAEEWPKDSVTDATGNIYKQVSTPGGGVEVWQFLGIFGSPEEALQSVGLKKEPARGKDTVVIGSKPYTYELKKTSGKETGGAVKEKKGRKVRQTTRSRKLRKRLGLRTVLIRNPKARDPRYYRYTVRDGGEKDIFWVRMAGGRRRTTGVTDLVGKTVPYNQTYLQDNRGSGR